ncbi:hypothetical protein ABTN40_20305, partial [Acinetobacter baumannii]
MARVIQEKVKKPLAEELLFGKLANGGEVHVSLKVEEGKDALKDGTLSFELTPAAPRLVKKKKGKGAKPEASDSSAADDTPTEP